MEVIKIDQTKIDNSVIAKIASALRQGMTIAYPTDTVYGLGCLADNNEAIKKIIAIKQSQAKKNGFILLIADMPMAKRWADISPEQEKYLAEVWPGPVTVILHGKLGLSSYVYGPGNSLAMRLPKNNFLCKIIAEVDAPLLSTSLNICGQEPVADPGKISLHFKKAKPDLVVDRGLIRNKKVSKIIDITNINNIKILRA